MEGVEPTHSFDDQILSLARLPILATSASLIIKHLQQVLQLHFSVSILSLYPRRVQARIKHRTRKAKGLKKQEEHLSKMAEWRSFPKVPHLLQYAQRR